MPSRRKLECRCGSEAFRFIATLELAPGDMNDEEALQVVQCERCSARYGALYEESRRGSSERWHHFFVLEDAAAVNALERVLRACPRPTDSTCDCRVHRALAAAGAVQRVQALEAELFGAPARPSVDSHFVPRPVPISERLLILLGGIVIVWCAAIAEDRSRWVLRLLAPVCVGLALWFGFLPHYPYRQEPRWWRTGMWTVFALGLGAGLYLAFG